MRGSGMMFAACVTLQVPQSPEQVSRQQDRHRQRDSHAATPFPGYMIKSVSKSVRLYVVGDPNVNVV